MNPYDPKQIESDSTAEAFPKGIEVTCGLIIRNTSGEILVARSPKWTNTCVLPGGHIEPGESIEQAAVREGKEETGLDLKIDKVIGWGELIGSPDFKRSAHFIFFVVALNATGGKLSLDSTELSDPQWVAPGKLKTFNLGQIYSPSISQLIEKYIENHQ